MTIEQNRNTSPKTAGGDLYTIWLLLPNSFWWFEIYEALETRFVSLRLVVAAK